MWSSRMLPECNSQCYLRRRGSWQGELGVTEEKLAQVRDIRALQTPWGEMGEGEAARVIEGPNRTKKMKTLVLQLQGGLERGSEQEGGVQRQ